MLYVLAAVCGVSAAALLLVRKKIPLRAAGMAAALLVAAAAFLLAQTGLSRGLLFFRPACAPEEAVEGFFDAWESGEEENARAYLADGTLPLGQRAPEDDAAAELFAARQESFSWALAGEASIEGLEARVPVCLTTLDLGAMRAELRELVMARLEKLVDARDYDEIYDENGMYRPAVTDTVYREAVHTLLEERERFEKKETLTLRLRYEAPDWHILPDAALSAALGADFDSEANNAKSAVLDGLTYIRKIYRIGENDLVAPAPDPARFGTTTDPAVIRALIEDSAMLLEGQDTVWSEDIELLEGSEISYYCDETILVIVWKENIGAKGCTFAEVRIADPSQLRRRLSGDVARRALAVVALFLAMLVVGALAISLIEDGRFSLADVFFETSSALGTVGVSSIGTPNLRPASRAVLLPMMFLGRIGPLTLALAVGKRQGCARKLSKYPEEKIMIG